MHPTSSFLRPLVVLFAACAALALSACSTTSPDVIQPRDAQRLSNVQDAVVLNVRPVVVEGQQSGTGAVAGGVVGGIAGGTVGGRRESAAVAIIGAAAGAVIGNTVERFGTREDAVEILIQLTNGDRRAIVQAKGTENIAAGDAVILINTGGKTRVIKAPPVQGR
ncbi:glycine zipper 2TM domain-containing protein [Leptothrix discophora]|uniref:Glycine zipper 2TM domain-containing protein n=1 Tax=Leptothrix discophora TaxID=89 RepID=A0ABT9G478_LEPDI|nr:glycine zipper 2TM domain-containing protein [Leptothrix discophora]MDP4301052.1 glycine zipper 2TM domain-containing protein [Leptothrix discophora]